MNVKSLSLNLSQKVNLGNFETKAISIGASAEIEENEDLTACKTALATKLNQMLAEEIAKEKKALLVATSRH
jgi:hypothetical protein